MPLFDLPLLDRRRRRALALAKPSADFLLKAAVTELGERLAVVNRTFAVAVDIATPGPHLAEAVAASGRSRHTIRLDRLPAPGPFPSAVADPAALPLAPASVDLAVSALGLQWVEDLPGALLQLRRALRPDGLFLAAIVAGDTLSELRIALAEAEAELRGGASPRVAPLAGLRDLGALLQRAGFALPVADHDRLTVTYADALALMRDLRAMGAANVLSARDRRPLTRTILARAAAIYAGRFSAGGRIRATFDIAYLSGWAPHESQQKALRPGSARTRLADALGTAERPSGDKARP